MTFHIITLFPSTFRSYLGESILKRAIEDNKIRVKFYNPRDFAGNKHRRIDRPPYGGGPGMVIQAEPVIKAIEKAYSNVLKNIRTKKEGILSPRAYRSSSLRPKRAEDLEPKIIWLSPSGKQFTNQYAKKTGATCSDLIIICGRYEGIDARVKKIFSARGGPASGGKVEEVSVGPYVLTGGELPAMLIIDAISRQVPSVLGNSSSLEESRVASSEVYTRPEVFEYKGKKYRVPKVLLSGHHAEIEKWKALSGKKFSK